MMIVLDQRVFGVRKMLRALRRPHVLVREPLALRLCGLMDVATGREAVLQLVNRTFEAGTQASRLREILVRCDFEGQKSRTAAAGMHLSLRQFFRCRAEAVEALAAAIERLEEAQSMLPGERPRYCAQCHRLLSIESSSGYEPAGQSALAEA